MELQTERLLLRPWTEEDAECLYRYAKDPAVGPICGWPPHQSVAESRQVIRTALRGSECYAVCLKADRAPIGSVELMLRGQTDMTDRVDECELGYWLGKPFWGRGIMPEAAGELIRHGFEELNMRAIWCCYYEGNAKSRRVQEKLGFMPHHVSEALTVPLLNEVRRDYANLLTRAQWLTRRTE